MTSRRHIGYIAGIATLLAAFPLSTIYLRWTWLIQCLIAVVLVTGAATLARTLRAPLWAQALAMGGALLAGLTWLFPGDGTALLGIIPTDRTFAYFGQLLSQAGTSMQEQGIPVQDDDGLLFLTMLGVGAVGICIDLCAVGLRRPALAGLPMLAIYSVPVAVHVESVPVIPFIAGAAGYLWLLVTDNVDRVRRFGRRFTGEGRDIDVWEPSPLAAAGRRLAVVGVLVAIALPVAVPGMTTGLLDRFGTGEGNGVGPGAGRAGSVNLWALLEGQLNQDTEFPMLSVETNDPNPYYLRMAVSDVLAADGFRNRVPSSRTPLSDLPNPRETPRADVNYVDAQATVRITNLDMPLLPVFTQPVQTGRLDNSWVYDNNLNVIYSNRSSTKGRTYTFSFVRTEYSPEALRRANPLPPSHPIQQQLTRVPSNVQQIQEFVEERTAGLTTPYDRVRALYDYFSLKNGFTYAIEARSDTNGAAISDFLFAKKAGYCVQYAAALAWLVRLAGIPARVAFGFTRGQRDGDTYQMTNLNLHSWTEVYFDGFGWVPFDATPSSSVQGSVVTSIAPNVDAPDPTASLSPGATPGPGGSIDPSDPTNPRNNVELGEENFPIGGPGTPADARWPGYLAIGAIVVLLLLATPSIRRAFLRRRRRPTLGATVRVATDERDGPPAPLVVVADGPDAVRARRDAHAAWDELIDTLVDYRIPVDHAETPRMTAERIVRESELYDGSAAHVRLLGSAEERARYAREPLRTDQLWIAVRGLRKALADRVSRRTRIWAMLLPRSVLQRWRNGTVDTVTNMITTVGAARDTVLRTFNPRRLLPARSR